MDSPAAQHGTPRLSRRSALGSNGRCMYGIRGGKVHGPSQQTRLGKGSLPGFVISWVQHPAAAAAAAVARASQATGNHSASSINDRAKGMVLPAS